MFGSSMKQHAIVNIITGSNMFTIRAPLAPTADVPEVVMTSEEVCRHRVDTLAPHTSLLCNLFPTCLPVACIKHVVCASGRVVL